jgi:hypothetical protein
LRHPSTRSVTSDAAVSIRTRVSRLVRDQVAADVVPVHPRQVTVQHDDVIVVDGEPLVRGHAVVSET